jgi:hypothetical protein
VLARQARPRGLRRIGQVVEPEHALLGLRERVLDHGCRRSASFEYGRSHGDHSKAVGAPILPRRTRRAPPSRCRDIRSASDRVAGCRVRAAAASVTAAVAGDCVGCRVPAVSPARSR